jgi:hypothetical protein
MERDAVPPRDEEPSGPWTALPASGGPDDWVVTNVAQAVRPGDEPSTGTPDDGTPIEGSPAAPPPSGLSVPMSENAFVAGEIDVPTPSPEGKPTVEFKAASKLLSGPEPADPDTGSHTPALERRS